MTQGQQIHIRGNLTGHLEVLFDSENAFTERDSETLFYFYGKDGKIYAEVTFSTVSALFDSAASHD
jgi:hypothetical protein